MGIKGHIEVFGAAIDEIVTDVKNNGVIFENL